MKKVPNLSLSCVKLSWKYNISRNNKSSNDDNNNNNNNNNDNYDDKNTIIKVSQRRYQKGSVKDLGKLFLIILKPLHLKFRFSLYSSVITVKLCYKWLLIDTKPSTECSGGTV